MPVFRFEKLKDKNVEKALMKKLKDSEWIWENRHALVAEYDNKYVAVMDKKVLYSDADRHNLLTQIKADGKNAEDFAISFVSEYHPCYLLECHARR